MSNIESLSKENSKLKYLNDILTKKLIQKNHVERLHLNNEINAEELFNKSNIPEAILYTDDNIRFFFKSVNDAFLKLHKIDKEKILYEDIMETNVDFSNFDLYNKLIIVNETNSKDMGYSVINNQKHRVNMEKMESGDLLLIYDNVIEENLIKNHIDEHTKKTSNSLKRIPLNSTSENSLYYALIANTKAVIYTKDLNGKILFVNHKLEELLESTSNNIVGKTDYDLFSKEEADNFYMYDQEIIKTKQPKETEGKFLHKDGFHTYITIRFPLINKERVIYGVGCIATDITERIRKEEKDKEQSRRLAYSERLSMLGHLASGIAHEINNPNSFIMLNTPMLKDISEGICKFIDDKMKNQNFQVYNDVTYNQIKEEIPKLFNGITEGSVRINKIVQKLHDFTRPNDFNNTQFDFNKLIKDDLMILKYLIRKSTENFQIKYGNIPEIYASRTKISQVFIAIVTNACQAITKPTQLISIETQVGNNNNIQLIVTDNGEGISDMNLRHIFNPFFTTRREHGSVGLGLSISNEIIKEYDGFINITSELDQGTTVIVDIPISKVI